MRQEARWDVLGSEKVPKRTARAVTGGGIN